MDIKAEIQKYLHETLAIDVVLTEWEDRRRLPVFLRNRYACFRAEILDRPCLLVADVGEEKVPPATIRKHIEQIQAKWDSNAAGQIVYVRKRGVAYERKRLIEQRIPFIVPGNSGHLSACSEKRTTPIYTLRSR